MVVERKDSTDEFTASEGFCRILWERVKEAILVVQDGRIRFLNERAVEVSGYSRDEMLSMPIEQIIHEEDRKAVVDDLLGRLYGTDKIEDHVFRCVNKQGQIRWVESASSLLAWDGRPAVLMCLVDITDRKLLELQAFRSQKLELLGRLARGVAHDINNLMTVVIGYSSLLLMIGDRNDPRMKNVRDIKKAGERATALTRQLLTFSRKQPDRPVEVNLNHTIADMESLLRRLLGEHIDLKFVLEPALWPIKADPAVVEQMLMILAAGARSEIAGGGRFTLQTKNDKLPPVTTPQTGKAAESCVIMEVNYEELKVDSNPLREVLPPMSAGGPDVEDPIGDLSALQWLVGQGGGAVVVEEAPHRGRSFRICFPSCKAGRAEEGSDTPVPDPAVASSNHETILVVEDDDLVRNTVRESLELFGYHVIVARNGRQALTLSDQHKGPIHLMLTDVVMPGMNGVSLAARLLPQRQEMKVLFMSGYNRDARLEECLQDKRTAFIHKPLSPDKLDQAIRKLLNAD